MDKFLIGVVIALAVVVLGAGVYLFSTSTGNAIVNSEDLRGSGDSEDTVKTFAVDSRNFRFYMNGVENPDIRVNQGDRVRIELSNSEGFHDWVVDEFNAATQQISAGNSSSVEFIADKKGTFEYYCSVGEHRQNGMKGNLIVE